MKNFIKKLGCKKEFNNIEKEFKESSDYFSFFSELENKLDKNDMNKDKNDMINILDTKGIYLKNFIPFNFVTISDFGSNHLMKILTDSIKKVNPNFIISAGDNNYPYGHSNTINRNVIQWFGDYIGNYKSNNYKDNHLYQGKGAGNGFRDNRFFTAIGNHGWVALNSKSENILAHDEVFTLPGIGFNSSTNNNLYYDYRYGNCHFFVLQSHMDIKDNRYKFALIKDINGYKKQYDWFIENVKKSKMKFKIVIFHHNPIGKGASSYMNFNFSELGVNLVIYGHIHNYSRKTINNVCYINCGSGSTIMSYNGNRNDFDYIYDRNSKFEKYINGTPYNAFVNFNVNENYIDIEAINSNNVILDKFKIIN